MYDFDLEKRESIQAGRQALYSLKKAYNELNGARNWGVVDILGGGMITTFMKHSKMNKAQQFMEQAKWDLHCFSQELEDILPYINLDFNTADFLSFADYFWDGFVADWLMQTKIHQTRKQVNQAIHYVESILRQLS